MRYQKKSLTFDEQVELLAKRGMVGDPAAMKARLSTVNYYRLSAYWHTFRVSPGTPDERIKPGTHFDHVWDRYVFDQRLRLLVMEAIERVEVAARTQVAYHHAHTWGPFAYSVNPSSLPRLTDGPLTDNRSHAAFVDEVRKCVRRGKDQPFVKHFQGKYTSSPDLPIWMATEIMSLGCVLTLYQGCLDSDRDRVAAAFGVPNSVLASWLLMLLNVRNICAHHGRLWNRNLVKPPALPGSKTHPDWYQPYQVNQHKLFAALTICTYLLGVISSDTSWPRRMRALIEEYESIPKEPMGIPTNWLDSELWKAAR